MTGLGVSVCLQDEGTSSSRVHQKPVGLWSGCPVSLRNLTTAVFFSKVLKFLREEREGLDSYYFCHFFNVKLAIVYFWKCYLAFIISSLPYKHSHRRNIWEVINWYYEVRGKNSMEVSKKNPCRNFQLDKGLSGQGMTWDEAFYPYWNCFLTFFWILLSK